MKNKEEYKNDIADLVQTIIIVAGLAVAAIVGIGTIANALMVKGEEVATCVSQESVFSPGIDCQDNEESENQENPENNNESSFNWELSEESPDPIPLMDIMTGETLFTYTEEYRSTVDFDTDKYNAQKFFTEKNDLMMEIMTDQEKLAAISGMSTEEINQLLAKDMSQESQDFFAMTQQASQDAHNHCVSTMGGKHGTVSTTNLIPEAYCYV